MVWAGAPWTSMTTLALGGLPTPPGEGFGQCFVGRKKERKKRGQEGSGNKRTRNKLLILAHQTSDDKLADTHPNRTVDKQRTATSFIDEKEHDGCEDDKKRVLNTRANEVDVSRKTGHLEDVDHVIGHHVCARHLLPCSVRY